MRRQMNNPFRAIDSRVLYRNCIQNKSVLLAIRDAGFYTECFRAGCSRLCRDGVAIPARPGKKIATGRSYRPVPAKKLLPAGATGPARPSKKKLPARPGPRKRILPTRPDSPTKMIPARPGPGKNNYHHPVPEVLIAPIPIVCTAVE